MLDVFGSVEIDFGGGRGRLVAEGHHLVLDVDEPSTLVAAADLRFLRRLAAGLTRAGLTLDVRSGKRLLLSAGLDARPGLFSRLLGMQRVRISPRFALRSALGRGHSRP